MRDFVPGDEKHTIYSDRPHVRDNNFPTRLSDISLIVCLSLSFVAQRARRVTFALGNQTWKVYRTA